MPSSREDLLRMLIPAAVAVALTLIFFAVFDRWNDIHDPINSIVVSVIGVVGFGAGVALDRALASRGRTRPGGSDGAPPA